MRTRAKQTALCATILLAWAGLVAFQVGAFGFGAAGVLGLVLGATLLGFCISALVGIATRRWNFTLYFGIALFSEFSSLWAAGFISERQRLPSIVATQPIIAAAERFHIATGSYPRSFDDLVPAYLSTEPRTKMGIRGTYFILSSSPDQFHLSFELPVWMLCSYSSEAKQWEIND